MPSEIYRYPWTQGLQQDSTRVLQALPLPGSVAWSLWSPFENRLLWSQSKGSWLPSRFLREVPQRSAWWIEYETVENRKWWPWTLTLSLPKLPPNQCISQEAAMGRNKRFTWWQCCPRCSVRCFYRNVSTLLFAINWQNFCVIRATLNNLLGVEDGGESLIYAACLLYPDLVKQLIEKVAKQNLNSDLRKSYFTGYQSAKWSDMLQHVLFSSLDEEPLAYPWLMPEGKNTGNAEDDT